jgi:hypothetical protein
MSGFASAIQFSKSNSIFTTCRKKQLGSVCIKGQEKIDLRVLRKLKHMML